MSRHRDLLCPPVESSLQATTHSKTTTLTLTLTLTELLVGVQEGVGGVLGEILVVGGYTGTDMTLLELSSWNGKWPEEKARRAGRVRLDA